MNNDLNQIRIFCQVAQLQSFTRAADILGIEKSTVSNKINQLETRLGVKLLQRTTRSVKLTEAGAQYLDCCLQALEQLQQGENLLSELQQEVVGKLRIAVPQNFADLVLPSILTSFMQQHPKVTLEVNQGKQQLDLIKEGYDLAVRARFSEVEDSGLIYRKIYQSKRVFVASPEHIKAYGHARDIKQLMQQPYIGSYSDDNHEDTFNQVFSEGKWHSLNARLSVNSMPAILNAAETGLGFTIVPVGMVREKIAQGLLVQIAENVAINDSVIYLVYPSRQGQPAKLKAFINTMLDWGNKMMAKQKT